MSVKRYEVNGSSSVFEDENGSLVDYDDYVSLEVKLDESLRYGRQADATIHNLELKITDMAVQLANAESKCRELDGVVAENVAMKAAFDKPQAYLSWHAIPPTWEDPLPCGEYLDVHEEAGHKNSDGTDCWPVFAKPEIETPATDAFMDEVRAQVWIEGSEPEEFGRYWVRYETDVGPQYCSAKWMEHNFCAGSNTNIHKIWLADHSRSINSLRGVTHYTKLPDSLEGAAQ